MRPLTQSTRPCLDDELRRRKRAAKQRRPASFRTVCFEDQFLVAGSTAERTQCICKLARVSQLCARTLPTARAPDRSGYRLQLHRRTGCFAPGRQRRGARTSSTSSCHSLTPARSERKAIVSFVGRSSLKILQPRANERKQTKRDVQGFLHRSRRFRISSRRPKPIR